MNKISTTCNVPSAFQYELIQRNSVHYHKHIRTVCYVRKKLSLCPPQRSRYFLQVLGPAKARKNSAHSLSMKGEGIWAYSYILQPFRIARFNM